MSPSRIDAMTQVARACIAGEVAAVETCVFLSAKLFGERDLLSQEDTNFLRGVSSEVDALPVGRLRKNWHPDFLPAKLEELERYEARVVEHARQICGRLLATMEARKQKLEAHEDS